MKTSSLTSWEDNIPHLSAWFDSEQGQGFLIEQKERIEPLLAQLFGYHLLQIGTFAHVDLCASSKINHCLKLSPQYCADTAIIADELLPFAHESLDVVFVHHVLESSDQPHLLLRELARVIIPSGHVVIAGFNPYSFLAIQNKLQKKEQKSFKNSFLSAKQLSDYLFLLGFAIESIEYGFYQLPILKRFPRLNRIFMQGLQRWQLPLGGFYLLHAVKQESRMTPLMFQNRARKGRIGLAAPSAYRNPKN